MFLSEEAFFEEEKNMRGKIVSLLTAIVFAAASLIVPVAASAQSTTGSAPTAEKAAATKKAPAKSKAKAKKTKKAPKKAKAKKAPAKKKSTAKKSA